MMRVNVLLVEDDPDFAALICHWLCSNLPNGTFQITQCRTFQQSVEVCRMSTPDVVILNLHLRDSSRQETLARLRTFESPVLVLSSLADEEVEEAMFAGAAEAMSKGKCNDHTLLVGIMSVLSSAVLERKVRTERARASL